MAQPVVSATPAASPLQDSSWQPNGGGDPGRESGAGHVDASWWRGWGPPTFPFPLLCTAYHQISKDRQYELKAWRTEKQTRGQAAIQASPLPQCALSVRKQQKTSPGGFFPRPNTSDQLHVASAQSLASRNQVPADRLQARLGMEPLHRRDLLCTVSYPGIQDREPMITRPHISEGSPV